MKKKVCIIFTVILCVICATAYYFGTEKKNCSEPNNKINKFVRVEQYDRNVYKYDFYNVKGEKIYDIVYNSMPDMLNPKLTASWEKGLDMVAKKEIKPEEFMVKLKSYIHSKFDRLVVKM